MLQAKMKGWLSRTYTLTQEDREVARLEIDLLQGEGSLIVNGERSALRRRKELPEGFRLEKWNGDVIVHAEMPNAGISRFVITNGDMQFELSKNSVWKSKLILSLNGEPTGTIRTRRWFSVRSAEIALPESLSIEVRAFIFWLATIQWTRDAVTAAVRGA